MITITIASKHEDDRKAISGLLERQDDFNLIHIGKDGYDALKSAKTHQPDIIIMDFVMEDIESSDLAPIIKRNSPSTAFIVLCSDDEQSAVAKALNAGISGYLLRDEGFDNLASSIRSVFHGGLYVSKSVKNSVLNCFSTPTEIFQIGSLSAKHDFPRHSFTLTEADIFYGISRGHTDREIAKDLNMSIGSLRNCVNHVKKKTGLQNRTQITVFALLSGIISIGKIKDTFL